MVPWCGALVNKMFDALIADDSDDGLRVLTGALIRPGALINKKFDALIADDLDDGLRVLAGALIWCSGMVP